ncbi:MAG: B12-binding domain-containing radical SAM protein [Actinobacteria bacterium]|nr:B12-binding domain-containing radical SAM protein [Actinomycetota bacterium]
MLPYFAPDKSTYSEVGVRITLIEPAAPGFHVYSFVKQLRLGLPLLGALLKGRGHDVRIYAESLSDVDWDDVLSSDLVGVSTTTSTAIRAYRYAQKTRDAGIPTVMGGPHVTFLADEAMDFCDYVIRQEGEQTLLELVDHLQGRGAVEDILGLSFRAKSGEVVHNPDRPLLTSLTDLPWPDMDLVVNSHKVYPTPILASRGCPFGCEFCSVILMFGRRVRTIEPVEVVRQIKRTRPRKLFFYDDNFFISKRRGKELLREMIREGAQTEFFAQIRVDSVCKDGQVDQELLDLLWEAGCRIVYLGLESINPATLKEYHKESSVDDMAGGLEALANRGIKTHGMFVFGADSDTVESLLKTADFAVDHGLNSIQFLALTPLPGTPQTAQFEAEGRIFTKNWSLYDGHHVVFWPKRMTPYELQEVLLQAHKRFYRARRIVDVHPKAPMYHKHQLQGYLISRAWEHVRENRDFLRELKDFSESQAPPVALSSTPFKSGLETVSR